MTYERDFAEEKCKKEYDKLEEDFDKFIEYYNKNKKCSCPIDQCKHYRRAEKKVFKERIHYVWNLKLQGMFMWFNELEKRSEL